MTFRSQQLFANIFYLSFFLALYLSLRYGPSNIVGSDLVWRPHLHEYDQIPLLLFVQWETCKTFWVIFVFHHNSKLYVSVLTYMQPLYFWSTSVANWLKHNRTTRFVSNVCIVYSAHNVLNDIKELSKGQ